MSAGYIYAIGPVIGDGPIKLGLTTRSLSSRLREIQTGHPEQLRVIDSAEVYDVFRAEAFLHQRYAAFRLHGEWFNISKEQAVEAINSVGEHRATGIPPLMWDAGQRYTPVGWRQKVRAWFNNW